MDTNNIEASEIVDISEMLSQPTEIKLENSTFSDAVISEIENTETSETQFEDLPSIEPENLVESAYDAKKLAPVIVDSVDILITKFVDSIKMKVLT